MVKILFIVALALSSSVGIAQSCIADSNVNSKKIFFELLEIKNSKPDQVYRIDLLKPDTLLLEEMREFILPLKNLNVFEASSLKITELPNGFSKMPCLNKVVLRNNRIKEIPFELLQSKTLQRLDLSINMIDTISSKDLNGIHLSELLIQNQNVDKVYLKGGGDGSSKLKKLLLDNNALSISADFFSFPNLLELSLNKCSIESLPNLSECRRIQYLSIANNSIKSLSNELDHLNDLSFLDLSNNPISSLPEVLYTSNTLTYLDLRGTNIASTLKERLLISQKFSEANKFLQIIWE